MVNQPINKFIAEDYRRTLNTSDSPSFIDTEVPVAPVAVINNRLPVANANQRLRVAGVYSDGTTRYLQIATASSTIKVHFLGMQYYCNAAVAANMIIWDATSGTPPAITAGAVSYDENAYFCQIGASAVGQNGSVFVPLPKEVTSGIRVQLGGAGQLLYGFIYWIEEYK